MIAAQFEEARAFSEGLAGVKIKGKWGFINLSGELIIPAHFDTVMPFKDGLAKVTAGSISGYINNKGEYLWVSTQNKSFAKGLLD